ncbi:MAG: M15 family metallopeptidase, partial [Microbacterium sp.]|uniref:M15 family metallopeptidase n=1 Tax=Microbacterium sp. TaxID=51671 RepID=UPI0039E49838
SAAPAQGRRAARAAALRGRRRRAGVIVGAVLVVILLAAWTPAIVRAISATAVDVPPAADSLPVPQISQASASASICDDPDVQTALAAGDDEAVITAAGGGEVFREAVADGTAPCISLSDADHRWVVVNKARPLDPIDYVPSTLVTFSEVSSLNGGSLGQEAMTALAALAEGAETAGVGEIASLSSYRSYTTQQSTYAEHVSADGTTAADLESARPGYSEHQTGLALDLVACGSSCGGLDDFGASAQGQWVAQNAWQYGFIVRYEDGYTDTTGYKAEPWHLRFMGVQLAQAYHDGGFHTLEDFFGLPAAPDYVD